MPTHLKPKLSDSVDTHRVPLGSAVRMGRRNLFAGRRSGSKAAQIMNFFERKNSQRHPF